MIHWKLTCGTIIGSVSSWKQRIQSQPTVDIEVIIQTVSLDIYAVWRESK